MRPNGICYLRLKDQLPLPTSGLTHAWSQKEEIRDNAIMQHLFDEIFARGGFVNYKQYCCG